MKQWSEVKKVVIQLCVFFTIVFGIVIPWAMGLVALAEKFK